MSKRESGPNKGQMNKNFSQVVLRVFLLVTAFQLFRGHLMESSQTKDPTLNSHATYTNRLIHEKSPYLLQHAHNPVDWYPWGKEAFDKARKENKPIFLSVGYSTCHWCHVMEEESFSNPEIARILNEHFVSIKVDREERPDVDRVYMTFVEATTGGGGWPMNVWLTPDLKPFVGGTYYPPEDRWGRPGLHSLLLRIAETWNKNGEQIHRQAEDVIRQLQKDAKVIADKGELDEQAILSAYHQMATEFDKKWGGFGAAPKFPRPVSLYFLFSVYAREGPDSEIGQSALKMSLLTLRKMVEGGIHDHLGGGFHRYSVDAYWHVPHFEKMLYDQAQLVVAYLNAYQITKDTFFAGIARDILQYVARDLRDSRGGFYSAEDADSLIALGSPKRAEGAFYIWTYEQITKTLSEKEAQIFCTQYSVEAKGNVPADSDAHAEFAGQNILAEHQSISETAKQYTLSETEARQLLEDSRRKLFEYRSRRPRPQLDDKIVTAWNGLMISAFARASQILNDPHYLQEAKAAATFLQAEIYESKDHTVRRFYRQGAGKAGGILSDYTFLIQGLIDLYETSFETRWLVWAMELQNTQDALFWDPKNGGYFDTAGKDPTILLRTKEDYDGAEPAPNSVAALNLLRLGHLFGSSEWQKRGQQTLRAYASQLRSMPFGLPQMLVALDFQLRTPKQVVIAGQKDSPDTRAMLQEVHSHFLPNKVLILADQTEGSKFFSEKIDFIKSIRMIGGKATAYVCEDYVCKLPTTDLKVMSQLLSAK